MASPRVSQLYFNESYYLWKLNGNIRNNFPRIIFHLSAILHIYGKQNLWLLNFPLKMKFDFFVCHVLYTLTKLHWNVQSIYNLNLCLICTDVL